MDDGVPAQAAPAAASGGEQKPRAVLLDPENRSPRCYTRGTAPLRARREPAPGGSDLSPTGNFRILILHSGSDVSEIQAFLRAFPDVAAVDSFDGGSATPTLADLAPYGSVLVANDYPFPDPAAIGNVLADYVDQGGGVVLTLASFVAQWSLGGRLETGGYMPLGGGTGPVGSASLGAFNAQHPIMRDVTSAAGDLLADASLMDGADLVASWNNGLPFVATKGRHVAAVNVFVALSGYWTGDVARILHNAAFWSSGVTWLSADPTTAVVPAGGRPRSP